MKIKAIDVSSVSDEIATALEMWMSALKGPWVVHEESFLPANVQCDFAGRQKFLTEMAVKIAEVLSAKGETDETD